MLISFVIPCYRSEKNLTHVVETIQETVDKHRDFESEIILVNDCSPDDTWGVIKKLNKKYNNIVGVDIAKNSGQQCAIMAGLRKSQGDVVAVCDDDGQTPIETVFDFYDKMESEGYDVVCAKYKDRGDRSGFRKLGTKLNTAMNRFFLDKPEHINLSVYFLAKRFVVDEMIKYNNAYPHMGGLLIRTTYNIGNVEVDQKERASGKSGYNFSKLLSTWVNGLTTFSIKPLRLAVIFGMLMAVIGFISIVVLVIIKFTNSNIALGWTSMIATTILIGGMIMLVLGVIGEYVGRIYLSLNQQPQYVVRSVIEKSVDRRDRKWKN